MTKQNINKQALKTMFDIKNTQNLIKQIRHSIFITMHPATKQQLINQLTKIGTSTNNRQQTFLIYQKPFGLKLETISHQLLVKIPNELENINNITFTKNFNQLSPKQKYSIKNAIKIAIQQESKIRKKEENKDGIQLQRPKTNHHGRSH